MTQNWNSRIIRSSKKQDQALTMTDKTILTISQLNQQVKHLLDASFPPIWVEGEISNFAAPASGHWYFSLKDEGAQIRCAMFRGRNSSTNFTPENGQHILARAKATLYPARGDFQLIVDHMEPAGVGALQRAFEQLKEKLSKEGLFNEEHKQVISDFPQTIGVITSDTGAAIHDILSVLARRCPLIDIIIYPTLVQGDKAAKKIADMIQVANQRNECDLLLLSRGGGSLEDLWSFNEEIVARAIFESALPIVTGVGHEVDFTIADFVADYRAPTPSAAAEYVSPDQQELMQQLDDLDSNLLYYVENCIESFKERLGWLYKRLTQQHPKQYLQDQQLLLQRLKQSLFLAQQRIVENRHARLRELARALQAISPLATLSRGYAVAKKVGKILHTSKDIAVNDPIDVLLSDGELHCTVKNKT